MQELLSTLCVQNPLYAVMHQKQENVFFICVRTAQESIQEVVESKKWDAGVALSNFREVQSLKTLRG